MSSAGSGQPLAIRARVEWEDCDPAGIVYYPRFFDWINAAAHALARAMGITPEAMVSGGLGLPLVSASIDFRTSARLEDPIEVRLHVTRLGHSSLGLRYDILRVTTADEPTLLARAREERVYAQRDPTTWKLSPRPMSPAMRSVAEHYLEVD